MSQIVYDSDTGRPYQSIGPDGSVNQTDVDDAGRLTFSIENQNDWDGTLSSIDTGSEDDDDRVTAYTYDNNGNVATIKAYQSSTDYQTTTYTYGVTTSGSNLVSNSLLHTVQYPDSSGGTDVVTMEYDRVGRTLQVTDQRGVVRDFEYDDLGRMTSDIVTTIPGTSDVDTAIRRIDYDYNALGIPKLITSRSGTGAASTVVNEVKRGYTGFGQVVREWQEHDGTAGGTSEYVDYRYSYGTDAAPNLDTMRYPQGAKIQYGYASGVDATVGRVSYIRHAVGLTKYVKYEYAGSSMPVIVDYSGHPDVRLDYTLGSSDSDTYKSLSRFGQVHNQQWVGYSGSSDVDLVKIGYTYDLASNRVSRDHQLAMPSVLERDELYTYDGLNRLTEVQRGTITGTSTLSITTTDRLQTEKWDLTHLGNWGGYQFDGDGDELFTTSSDVDDSRTFNDANEITEWDAGDAATSDLVTPVYDEFGNMIEDGTGLELTFDAWNRLVKSVRDSTTLATYAYDGLGRRIVKNVGDVSGEDQHEYYTISWQRIETRHGSTSSSTGVELFVFGIRYIDDIVLRLRDENESDGPEEYRYYLTDANYNVVMTVDDAGRGAEIIRYSAYGSPECIPFGDVDGDHDVDSADALFQINIKNSSAPYVITADLDLDGDVDQDDVNLFTYYSGRSGGFDVLSVDEELNDIGYAGYHWDDEVAMWHVRHRELSPRLGRWVQRDPAGFEGSRTNLYSYVFGRPVSARDPKGLFSTECFECVGTKCQTPNSRFQNQAPPAVKPPPGFMGPMACSKNCYQRYLFRGTKSVLGFLACLGGFALPVTPGMAACVVGCSLLWEIPPAMMACVATCLGLQFVIWGVLSFKNCWNQTMGGPKATYCQCLWWKGRKGCPPEADLLGCGPAPTPGTGPRRPSVPVYPMA